MIKLEHEVTYDRLEREAQRLLKAQVALRARSFELERKAAELARAAAAANRSIAASLARLR